MNKTNNFHTYFTKNSDGTNQNIKFQIGDASVSFNSLNNVNISGIQLLTNGKNQISQRHFSGADYTIETNRLLEEIIVDSPNNIPTVSQSLHVENAYPKINGKTIEFYHKTTNKLLWIFPEPVMYEVNQRIDSATGKLSRFENYDLHYELKCNSLSEENVIPAKAGIYTNCFDFTLTKVIDPTGLSWLNDSSRVYPLVIDASVGPNSPGTMATDNESGGTQDWVIPIRLNLKMKLVLALIVHKQASGMASICLAADTLVSTNQKYKTISTIKIGDVIYSFNFLTNHLN